MSAANLIMNDDIEGAETLFRSRQSTSSFHQLGLGVATFMTSILGFEKEVMAEAASRLTESENRSWADLKKAQGSWYGRGTAAGEGGSRIYPPGSEFALIHAESQLMSAVVGVMHESLTEGLKGFYKLRKAFIALDGIMEAERRYLERVRGGSRPATGRMSEDMMPGSFDASEFAESESDSDEFVDASSSTPAAASDGSTSSEFIPSTDIFTTPTDIFIHSGTTMCYGILLLLISMVPPAFSRLLSIIGFKGDRERGVSMLWQATQARNVNGAIAGLVLLAYYNGLMGFADILPSDADAAALSAEGEIVGYPRERCMALLEDMRARYPESRLWKLQEAKELAGAKKLAEASALLASNLQEKGKKPSQTAALNAFELSLNTMFAMEWSTMRDSFLRCVELNKWSHAMYYFLAGCAELEMYRDAHHRAAHLSGQALSLAETEARTHKKAAEEYLRKAPTLAGRKRFLAKQMPFEVFVCRKVAKWEERVVALGGDADLADVILVSPAMEMTHLWNGSKRMDDRLLERARGYLSLDRCTMTPEQRTKVLEMEKDEITIQAVVEAGLLRSLGRTDEARGVLQEVLVTDKTVFRGATRDDYTLPAANYEMAAAAWADCCDETRWPAAADEAEAYRRGKTDECQRYLEKLAKWEAYVLDGRFGMRIQAGLDSVKWLKGKKGW
jgi:hypothetical protein